MQPQVVFERVELTAARQEVLHAILDARIGVLSGQASGRQREGPPAFQRTGDKPHVADHPEVFEVRQKLRWASQDALLVGDHALVVDGLELRDDCERDAPISDGSSVDSGKALGEFVLCAANSPMVKKVRSSPFVASKGRKVVRRSVPARRGIKEGWDQESDRSEVE
jgi:hypothetical protein